MKLIFTHISSFLSVLCVCKEAIVKTFSTETKKKRKRNRNERKCVRCQNKKYPFSLHRRSIYAIFSKNLPTLTTTLKNVRVLKSCFSKKQKKHLVGRRLVVQMGSFTKTTLFEFSTSSKAEKRKTSHSVYGINFPTPSLFLYNTH